MMETLELREIISKDWRTDDYIKKQLLCNKLKYNNQFNMHYILDYNMNDYDVSAEEKYIKDDQENFIHLNTYLNKNKELVDLVQTQCEIKFEINGPKEEISAQLIYFYHRDADTVELRRRKAIVLETFSYEEFRNLVRYVGYGDFENGDTYYKDYFIKIFKNSFLRATKVTSATKATDAKEIKFLYTQAPEFVLKGMELPNETIFGHILALTDLDDTGIFSGWKDGSSALINAIKALSSYTFLLEKFKANPELCNRIYFNLDGFSEMNGEMKSNRIIFATFLMEACLLSENRPQQGAPEFKIGNGYKVNTKLLELGGFLLGLGKSNDKTFYLQQQKEVLKRVFIVPKEGDPNATEQVTKDLDEGAQFYPLDMIYFKDETRSEALDRETEQEGSVTMMVPAIYVKALADAENWEDINETMRIVADVMGVVFGIGTLVLADNPYLLLAAVADLSLALSDLTIQAFREEIAKLPGGEEFLRQWDLIYNVLGAAVAAPQVVVGLGQIVVAFYRGCLSLLKLPETAEKVRRGLRTVAISVFLDLNSGVFQRKDLRMFSPTEWVIPSAGFFSKTSECDALIQNGAFFMELDAAVIMESINKGSGINPDVIGAISSNRKFALVYKGEIIAQGSRYDKAYQKVLQEIRKVSASSEKVKEILDTLWSRIPRLIKEGDKNYWTFVNRAGNGIRWEQVASEKINKLINSALSSSNAGILWEGKVAREISKYDEIIGFQNLVDELANGRVLDRAGDMDVVTSKYIIECKSSISKNIKPEKLRKQLTKYYDPMNERYMNPMNKKVVLAIEELGPGLSLSHPFFDELRNKGVIIITDINQIKTLK